ncbi:MAG: AAA family ATPase, partial [Oscillospiraceae bacterium]
MANVISIASGKGGVGKSTLCVGLGMAYALLGKSVLIIEFDVGLRGVDIMMGISDRIVYDLGDLLEGRCHISKAIIESPWNSNLNVIVAPISMESAIDMQDVKILVEGLRPHFDTIILDTPAGLGLSIRIAATVSDLTLVAVNPDSVCIRDGGRVVQSLVKAGMANHRLIIN